MGAAIIDANDPDYARGAGVASVFAVSSAARFGAAPRSGPVAVADPRRSTRASVVVVVVEPVDIVGTAGRSRVIIDPDRRRR